ncbi:unnamed protein product [Prorocentrum cordatum]|uniref:Uncharacterized protein n=1 Tax=Prorocentrum cordatum TaxID=2364126 RepID=A0ABN9VUD4_9DINO|nr:unnamed protein product [Polarella glacialis]
MAAGWRARAERGPAGYATRRTEHGRSAIGERRGGRRWAQHSAPRSRGQSRSAGGGGVPPGLRGAGSPPRKPRGPGVLATTTTTTTTTATATTTTTTTAATATTTTTTTATATTTTGGRALGRLGPQLRGLGADQMVGGSCALDGARSGGAVASDDALGDTAAPVSGLRKEKLRVAGEAPAAFTLLGFEGRRDLALRMASSLSWTSCSVSCARLPTSSLGWREPSSPMVRGTKGRHRH